MDKSFAVGDRVRALYSVGFGSQFDHTGEIGTVIEVSGNNDIGVFYDNDIQGHDLNGRCEDGHGWWSFASSLEKYYEDLPAFQAADHAAIMSLIGG